MSNWARQPATWWLSPSTEQLQAFADGYWLPDHATEDRAAAIILDAFKRKVAGQLELMDLKIMG